MCGSTSVGGGGVIITASITNEAVDHLGLAADQVAVAVIKASSDVMIGSIYDAAPVSRSACILHSAKRVHTRWMAAH
jgi:hypothetical protein